MEKDNPRTVHPTMVLLKHLVDIADYLTNRGEKEKRVNNKRVIDQLNRNISAFERMEPLQKCLIDPYVWLDDTALSKEEISKILDKEFPHDKSPGDEKEGRSFFFNFRVDFIAYSHPNEEDPTK